MLQLILGRSGCGKTTTVLKTLCSESVHRPQVLVVPEQSSHDAERALCTVGGASICLSAEVLSFTRLANRIFQDTGGLGAPQLDSGGRVLLMYQAVHTVADSLSSLKRMTYHPRFLQSLISTLDELKTCKVSPLELGQAGSYLDEIERNKLQDLALIFETYDALTARIAFDPREQLTRATEKIPDCAWAREKSFWLDGFTDFTAQQYDVIKALLATGCNVTIALTTDMLNSENEVFYLGSQTAQRLMRIAGGQGKKCNVNILNSEKREESVIQHLERTLFSNLSHNPITAEKKICLFRAQTPRSEVEWTAAEILRLVREEGYRFRDFAVVSRAFDRYSHLIQTVFDRYGVPVFCSQMTDILARPVLSLVTAALDTVVGGYRYEDMFQYLKTGLTSIDDDDRDLLENYVLKWDIRGAKWTQKKDWTMHPKGYGFAFQDEDTALLKKINSLRNAVIEPLEMLRKNSAKTAEEQAKTLYAFLEKIELPQQLDLRVALLNEQGNEALADEYRQLWEILCNGLEQSVSLLGDAPMELEEFSALFRLVLSQYTVGSIPISLDRVAASEIARRSDFREIKMLFLLGAEDSSLPMISGEQGLLNDYERAALLKFDIELGNSAESKLQREMTAIYRTCSLPTERLAVSWSVMDESGKECNPSFLVKRIELLFSDVTPIREGSLNNAFRLCAPLPALEQAGRNQRVYKALLSLDEYNKPLTHIQKAANWERGNLSQKSVEQLYGHRIPMSASRMDKYKSCHFSYFMRYGLRAEPRRTAGFDAPEYGTFIHYVLEHVLQAAKPILDSNENRELTTENKKLLRQWTNEAVERYTEENLGGLDGQNERFCYLFRRLQRTVHSVVENAVEELLSSDFRPISYELGFSQNGQLPPIELRKDDIMLSISGFVDRVDGWVHNDRLYLRVVDYKTGKKSFDLTEIFNGIGLQMLLYLFTLQEKGSALYGMPVEPAGVLYFPARDVIVSGNRGMKAEDIKKEIDKELVRKGLMLDDEAVINAMEYVDGKKHRFLPLGTPAAQKKSLATAERFGKLQKHIQRILSEICQELAAGDVAADPFWRGPQKNACQFCEYTSACHFEEGRGGDCYRWVKTLDNNTFWELLDSQEDKQSLS